MQSGPGMAGVGIFVFVLIYIVIFSAVIIGWIFFLVAVWRAMKAHESVAVSLRIIAEKQSMPPA
jgi:hypothetical protein